MNLRYSKTIRPTIRFYQIVSAKSCSTISKKSFHNDYIPERLIDKLLNSNRLNDIALIEPDSSGINIVTYKILNSSILSLSNYFNQISGKSDINNKMVIGCFTYPPINYVITMLACWKSNKVFVPLSTTHSINELSHFISDSNINLIMYSKNCSEVVNRKIQEIRQSISSDASNRHIDLIPVDDIIHNNHSNQQHFYDNNINKNDTSNDDALIIYTSGTTGKPKGVLHTHTSISHIISSLIEAWKYESEDKILHFLPLYHMHGLVNKLLCMLYVGATVEFLPNASPDTIWKRLAIDNNSNDLHSNKKLTLFMAVPTIYAKLIESSKNIRINSNSNNSYDIIDANTLEKAIVTLQRMRLHISGSAALPSPVMNDWKILTNNKHILLERYGMTEIGMALSNPYLNGERKIGSVGYELPFVECRLVDENENVITEPNIPGELRVK
eukprot:gene15470-20873_t